MNAMPIRAAFSTIGRFLAKHAPEILIGLGIAGTGAAIALTAKAAPKANDHIKQAEKAKGDVLTPVEKVKATWKDYAPAVAAEAASVACIIAGGSVQHRRNISLAAAYALVNSAAGEYLENVGDKKAKDICDSIAKAKVAKAEPKLEKVNDIPEGKILYIESVTGQPFVSDDETIKGVINTLNYQLNRYEAVTLNDLLYEFDLVNSSIGEDFGWVRDKGLIDISYSYAPDSKGRPCKVLKYNTKPDYLWN